MTRWQGKVFPGTNHKGEVGAVVLVTEDDIANDPKWAYVFVKLEQLLKFYNESMQPGFAPAKYGDIIEWGKGVAPPQQIIDKISEIGCDNSFQQQLEEQIQALFGDK